MRVLQIGNHGPPHSTETHLKRALEANGVEVMAVQESGVCFQAVPRQASRHHPDFVLWTHTHGLAPEATHPQQARMLQALREMGVPTVAYHLDRWWGLDREHQVAEEPFFRCDLVCTADGGHDAEWQAAGVNHRWFPPAVLAAECVPGKPRPEFFSQIAFVGSWQGGYHPEWSHRSELIRWLRDTYRERVRFWPRPGEHAVRGRDLCDLYASVDVVAGDSCLVPNRDGSPCTRYCSDRIPETLGRGGFLLHPNVEGITYGPLAQWLPDVHLATWEAGDWDTLAANIDRFLHRDAERERIAQAAREHTLRVHSYEYRMVELVGTDAVGDAVMDEPLAFVVLFVVVFVGAFLAALVLL